MAQIRIVSNLKLIDGTARTELPTTDALPKGYMCFGVINGRASIWGNYDDEVVDLVASGVLSELDAKNIFFTEDLKITEAMGYYQPDPSIGYVEIPLATDNMSLYDLLVAAYQKESQPTVTNPSCSVTLSDNGYKEVGTSFTPAYSVAFDAGSYQYGPTPTGATAVAYAITDTNGTTSTAASGTLAAFTIADDTNYCISATVTHTASEVPKTSLQNDATSVQIPAGTVSADSAYVYGYRASFYGTMTSKPDMITSANIRALTSTRISEATTLSVPVPVGAYRVVVALPSAYKVTSIKDVNGLNAELLNSFTSMTASVEGANSYTATTYNVYYLDYANANDTANTYTVTVAAA